MDIAVNEHKVATILGCIGLGLSPGETADIFRKQADAINAYTDHLMQSKDATEKDAGITDWVSPKSVLQTALLTAALPVIGAYPAGMYGGQLVAKTLTPVNETPVSYYQKADEILRMKKETSNIIARVEQKNKENEEKSKDRSVRSLF